MKNQPPTRPSLFLLCALLLLSMAGSRHARLPLTGGTNGEQDPEIQISLPVLQSFAAGLVNGNPAQVVGLYVEGVLALPVVAQPSGQPGYVSTLADTLTQFDLASLYGSLGFLAHNYLAGENFSNLDVGSLTVVIYGDGQLQAYQVSQVRSFQATDPLSPYSDFVDLQTQVTLSANELFFQTYGIPGQLVLQTCISAGGNDSWGRLFVVAAPVELTWLEAGGESETLAWYKAPAEY